MADFATPEDIVSRWRPFRDEAERARAEVRLGDASSLLRTVLRGIDGRVEVDPELARTVTSTVADVVARYMRNPHGAKAVQETIGDRSYGLTFDGEATGIFFTAEELARLRSDVGVVTHISFSVPYQR